MKKLRLAGAVLLIIVSTVMLGRDGAGMTNYVALLISLVFGLIYYFGKRRYAWLGAVAMWGLGFYITPYALKYFDKKGVNGESIVNVIAGGFEVVIIVGVMIAIPIWIFQSHEDKRNRIDKNRREDIIGCPSCGSRAVHYVELDGRWKCTKCKCSWTDDYTPFF
jgi:hypothetical protein